MLTTLRSLPRRFVIARWEDGWTLSRMPKMEVGAWFTIEGPDGRAPAGMSNMGFVVQILEDRDIVLQFTSISLGVSLVAEGEYDRPFPISEAYRRKVAWFIFEFMGLVPDQIEGLSRMHPSIPTIAYGIDANDVRRVQVSALKDWRDVTSEDLQRGKLFPHNAVRRYQAAQKMTDGLLRSLVLTISGEVEIYPREEDAKYAETRWAVDVDMRAYILVLSQNFGHPEEQPTWRLHRWDETTSFSCEFEMTRANLDEPSDRYRLLGTSQEGPFELLQQAGLVILEQDLDDWIDTHIEVPEVVEVVAQTMEAYDLLDSALYAPIFARQWEFYTWWKTLQETP